MPPVAAETGVKALFFAYFALVGAISPYLSLYFAAVGLTIPQIAVLMAIPQVVRIVAPPFWGWLADGAASRAALLRTSAAIALVLALLVPLAGGSYGWLALLVAAMYFATAAQAPLAETMALAASAGDAGRYGRMRLWGSIGFVAAVALTGPLLDAAGVTWLPAVMALVCASLLAVSWRVPEPPRYEAGVRRPVASRLREPAIAAFFAASFLMLFAHAALYVFYSLYLDRAGWSKSGIGFAWTVGVVCEIVLFRSQRPLFERFGALTLLAASLAVAAARFALVGWGGGWLPAVLLSQAMHAVTFGVHHSATMALLQRWFAPAEQGRAQALYVTIGYGLGGAGGGLFASWLWEAIDPAAAFYGAAAAAALGWVAAMACRRYDEGQAPGRRPNAPADEGVPR